MKYRLICLFFLVIGSPLKGQDQNCVYIGEPVYEYSLKPISIKLHEAILAGKITAYDEEKKRLSPIDFQRRSCDSAYHRVVSYREYHRYYDSLTSKYWELKMDGYCIATNNLNESIWISIISWNPDSSLSGKNLFLYSIKKDDLKKVLDSAEYSFFKYLFFKDPLVKIILTTKISDTSLFNPVHRTLVEKIEKGGLSIFYPNLQEPITTNFPEELLDFLGKEETYSIYPPEDEGWYFYDSTIWTPLQYAVVQYKVAMKEGKIIAIAPCYQLDSNANKFYGYRFYEEPVPFFWLKWEELGKTFDPMELNDFKKWLLKNLR